ncbi:hypothetical protein, partial [Bradyrhizobium sp. DOA1]|uniref:hypothetical protein n=1 Tax=Bradyrhizobium sp. DOA1 TaxID=1126616 RepID=UPI0018D3A75A
MIAILAALVGGELGRGSLDLEFPVEHPDLDLVAFHLGGLGSRCRFTPLARVDQLDLAADCGKLGHLLCRLRTCGIEVDGLRRLRVGCYRTDPRRAACVLVVCLPIVPIAVTISGLDADARAG